MDALGVWRDHYIKRKGKRTSMRPVSPSSALSEEEQDEDTSANDLSDTETKKILIERSKSEPPSEMGHFPGSGVKSPPPTSSSWVQWWRRSRRDTSTTSDVINTRPELKESFSAPNARVCIAVYRFYGFEILIVGRLVYKFSGGPNSGR